MGKLEVGCLWSKKGVGFFELRKPRTFLYNLTKDIYLISFYIILYKASKMFEFDKNKSLSNKKKHGIDFEEAQALWLDFSITLKSKNLDEERWLLIASHKKAIWVAIFTYRLDNIRIISVRKARENEKIYFEEQKRKNEFYSPGG